MFATLFVGAILGLAHPDPCSKALPRGPVVPAPLMLSTDCGWFRLEADGAVSRMPIDWLAKQNSEWRGRYGHRLTTRPNRSGRIVVVRNRHVIWRSTGAYYNDYMGMAFGRNAFAFGSFRRGIFLTNLESPERLVLAGRGISPLAFTAGGELLVAGRNALTVISPEGVAVRRYRFRRSTGYSFDERTKILYFVTPSGMLSAARGSALRRIAMTSAQGWISPLGRWLLAFVAPTHVVILRRRDGSLVARASWRRNLGELDAGVDVSDDGRAFAFRVSKSRPGVKRSSALVYLLRVGEGSARVLYRHRLGQAGCGGGGSVNWGGSSVLYRSVDATGLAETAILGSDGLVTRLTPLFRSLPRLSPNTPGNASWASDFS